MLGLVHLTQLYPPTPIIAYGAQLTFVGVGDVQKSGAYKLYI